MCLISIPIYGQNRYDIPNVYYNMDTANCFVIKTDNGYGANGQKIEIQPNALRSCRYVFKKQLSLPIVEVLDSSILMSIDALIGETIEDGNVFFPDTSGFCIDLTFAYEDEGEMKVYISPYANYYIYDVLFSETDKILFEWYGRYSHTNVGCFFYNEILCIVRLYNVPIAPQAQCYYSETSDSVQLNVFRDKVTIYKESYDPQKRYTMPSCHERRAN